MDLRTELEAICEAFEKKRIRYILIGGMAVALHGVPRYTEDIDFIFFSSNSELEKIKKALYRLYQDESIFDLTEKDLDYSVIRYGTPKGYVIDLMFKIGDVADYEKLKGYAQEIKIHGVNIKVLSKEGLLFLKKGSLRPQDQQDTSVLEKLLKEEKSSD